MKKRAVVLETLPKLGLSPDPDDNFVLTTALEGRAEYLVTGDKKDLLVLEQLSSLRIIKARTFLEEVLRLSVDGDD